MKNIFLLIVFVSSLINAQETQFSFDNLKGMTDFVITPVEGKNSSEIYKKALEWIKMTYKNPDKVILSTIENEYIRFEGSSASFYSVGVFGDNYRNAKYQIEISIKDNKYKFDIISLQVYWDSTSRSAGGWSEVKDFNSNSSKEYLEKNIFKKDGQFRSYYKNYPKVPEYFNRLNKSFYESILGLGSKNNDW